MSWRHLKSEQEIKEKKWFDVSLCYIVQRVFSEVIKYLQTLFVTFLLNFVRIAWIFTKIKYFTKENVNFFMFFFPINRKGFYQNFTKLSKSITKCIEIVMIKFKTSTMNVQRDIYISSKYFLAVHALMIAKKFFQNFIQYSMRQLPQIIIKYPENWKDIREH